VSIYQTAVSQWLDRFIVGLNICPFAKRPLAQQLVRISVVESAVETELTQALLAELATLVDTPRTELETTLIVHPNLLLDFDDFWAYLEWITEILEENGIAELIQVVGFHPDYYFDDAGPADLANYTNRSPYPLLHLLRQESVTEAVVQHPDIADIPTRNMALLRTMNQQALELLRTGHPS
jgi:uncharacterized protein